MEVEGRHTGLTRAMPRNSKTGRNMQVMPARLAERYEASITDGELMSARSDIALLDARANELLEKLNSLDSKQSWIKLQDAYTKLRKTKNQEEAGFLLEEIGKLITEGNREREVWDEIRECISSKL